MDLFVLSSVAILAVMAGYWAGRSVQWQMAEGVEEAVEGNFAEDSDGRGRNGGQKRIPIGQVIASPASGAMTGSVEAGKATVRISPEQGRVYAPASGRITRLYPMGSAMLLRTEFGAELMIRAGDHVDEMHSGHYRCRVMEHEVVRKGNLLLEYDVEGLRADGADAELTMCVENEESGGVTVSPNARVRVGDGVMWVR